MSKSNSLENDFLLLLFNNINSANIGDATGLRGSSTAGSFYVSLHSSDPGEAGDQTTNEIVYTSYARVAVARSGSGWTVDGDTVNPTVDVVFPAGTGGSGIITHFGIGTSASGAGKLLYSGTATPNIPVGNGITPRVSSATTIVED